MPLYEYQCDACGTRVEKIQKFSDPPLETCDKCGGKLTKLLSSPAIQFKGSGWYITDYARKSEAAAPKKESDTATPAAESKPAKTETPAADSKPAPATASKE